MRFVDNDKVPMDLAEARQYFSALRKIKRCDHAAALEPLIYAELLAKVLALHDQELCVEFLLEFALPLEGEVRRTDDEDSPLRRGHGVPELHE